MTDLPPKKAIPYDDLLALVYKLEQRSVEQHNTQCRQADVIAALEQQVRDLTAQLARHEATPRAHTYRLSALEASYNPDAHLYATPDGLGLVVMVDGAPVTLDYDPRDQMDVPITDDAQAAQCELTAEQRERIWAAVWGVGNGGSDAPQR